MKKIILVLSFLTLCLGSLLTQAQDLQVPAGTVIRTANCVITDDRFSFNDVVERARALAFDENDPDSKAKGKVGYLPHPHGPGAYNMSTLGGWYLSIPKNIDPVIRIKAPIKGENVMDDIIQGTIKVSNEEMDDFIIMRSDGTPTYMLSVVVDDHDMNVTHIVRGHDHLTNTFRQNIIYDAMKWNKPKTAHIPLILGSDGSKMSKRHGAIDVEAVSYTHLTLPTILLV